jgi:hypothetical protein
MTLISSLLPTFPKPETAIHFDRQPPTFNLAVGGGAGGWGTSKLTAKSPYKEMAVKKFPYKAICLSSRKLQLGGYPT